MNKTFQKKLCLICLPKISGTSQSVNLPSLTLIYRVFSLHNCRMNITFDVFYIINDQFQPQGPKKRPKTEPLYGLVDKSFQHSNVKDDCKVGLIR